VVKVVTCQPLIRSRAGKVGQPKTDVLTTELHYQQTKMGIMRLIRCQNETKDKTWMEDLWELGVTPYSLLIAPSLSRPYESHYSPGSRVTY